MSPLISPASAESVNCCLVHTQVNTTAHKMMYGHYLQKKGQHISVFCVSIGKLQKDAPQFMEELEKRWSSLADKRSSRVDDLMKDAKRQKALDDCGKGAADEASTVSLMLSESPASLSQGSKLSEKSTVPYGFLSPAEKTRLREECQRAWDLAFVVCGIPFAAADNPVLREAIRKTRGAPDFKLACAKTMRTTRLVKLDAVANEYKDLRLKAGERFGFAITSDGWRSVAKRNYHNYILLSVEGPIFITMDEVTGQGGTGEDIAKGFEQQFTKLGVDVTRQIILGITDTPSANRKAWRLLEANHPLQIWTGCAAHEVSLLFKEWVKKVPEIHQLFKQGHRVVKWIINHSEILKQFRELVPKHFTDKRKHCMGLYAPGDTRMATVFKMLHRLKVLFPVLTDLVSAAEYEAASQKALKQWSDSQPAGNKLTAIGGKYPDKVKHSIQDPAFLTRIDVFTNATKSAIYLLRLVDGQTPVIGKFYYCCALLDKHLRVLKEAKTVPYIDLMRSIFIKRWKRWHRPVHTFAYALDPCYQAHDLTKEERADCVTVTYILRRIYALAAIDE